MGRWTGTVLGAWCWVVACSGAVSREPDEVAHGGTAGSAGAGDHGAVKPGGADRGGADQGGTDQGGANQGGVGRGDQGDAGERDEPAAGAAGAAGAGAGGVGGADPPDVGHGGGGGGAGPDCEPVSCDAGYVEVADGLGCQLCEPEGCQAQREGYLELIAEVNATYGRHCTTVADCLLYYDPDDERCGVDRCDSGVSAAALPEMQETLTAYAAQSCNLICPPKVIGGALPDEGLWNECEPGVDHCWNGHCTQD